MKKIIAVLALAGALTLTACSSVPATEEKSDSGTGGLSSDEETYTDDGVDGDPSVQWTELDADIWEATVMRTDGKTYVCLLWSRGGGLDCERVEE